MLNRKAKLSFVRDAVIIAVVVCGGIFLYKNGAVITDGIQNVKENMEPLEKKTANQWATIFSDNTLHVSGSIDSARHLIEQPCSIIGDVRFGDRDSSMKNSMWARVNDYFRFGADTSIAEQYYFVIKPGEGNKNNATFVQFSTWWRDNLKENWKRDPKQMAFRYATLWGRKKADNLDYPGGLERVWPEGYKNSWLPRCGIVNIYVSIKISSCLQGSRGMT